MHNHEHIKKILDDALSKLGEHCDSVLIMVTIPCDECNGANSMCYGQGNPVNHLGMAHEFIARHNAMLHIQTVEGMREDKREEN